MIAIESEVRPWGRFFVLHEEFTFKKKQIKGDSGGRLSCQYHYKRAKVWTITGGTEVIKLDNQDNEYIKGQKALIPPGVKLSIENNGLDKVVFTGSYFRIFGENDFVRIQDDYNRA